MNALVFPGAGVLLGIVRLVLHVAAVLVLTLLVVTVFKVCVARQHVEQGKIRLDAVRDAPAKRLEAPMVRLGEVAIQASADRLDGIVRSLIGIGCSHSAEGQRDWARLPAGPTG
ncbi:hypothetical protein ACFZ8E_24330 [Methylobacterium sp. HMF5984]|uniref:hypothetical protein n=1 Tax=Methylobacterium sp. HMF5984 TaxID=3367370 RepID=UPI00385357E9